MALTDLHRTKIHLTGLGDEVTALGRAHALRSPRLPTYFHGSCLVLHGAPTDFPATLELHRATYGEGAGHRLILWGGEGASEDVLRDARAAGFRPQFSTSMSLETPPAADERFAVRPLSPAEIPAIEALNRISNGADGPDGDPEYRAFCEGLRGIQRGWIESGAVIWWGAFDGEELVGQCGFVKCDSEVGRGLGRFQSVEVHPNHRRRGVASALVATVARHGFLGLGCRRIIMEVDTEGPAIALYTRLGFEASDNEHGLLWSQTELHIRDEGVSDVAGVQALVTAAFGAPEEARVIASLRGKPGMIALVAERDGGLLGHVLASTVEVTAGDSVHLGAGIGPLAVRTTSQGEGVGSALMRAVIERCREGGHRFAVLLGSPDYYRRFGFGPASAHGLRLAGDYPEAAFQALALTDGGLDGVRGEARYDPAFDGV